ncbi:von Willebrand factor type A domain protein [Pelomyxa schiedti]|nr:von Willebrand factor type A domain protein [Pelomyxa schiedti]
MSNVSVEGCIMGLMGSYTITYTFRNSTEYSLETTFQFPLWHCQFETTVKGFSADMNGSLITGTCCKSELAFQIYDNAIASGHTAFLLDQERDNGFKLSLGNLAPGTEAKILVECVTQLITTNMGNGKQVRKFLIPAKAVSFFHPISYQTSLSQQVGFGSCPLHISMDIRMPCNSLSIESPSHSNQISVTKSMTEGVTHLECACDDAPLQESDFILVLCVSGSPTTLMYTEYSPRHNSTCIAALISPNITLQHPPSSWATHQREIIFLLDRSGSMSGYRITHAVRALQLFLRSIPIGTRINIIGFGTKFSEMYNESVCYSQSELERATKEVAKMESANMGGTELLEPLVHTLGKPFAVDSSVRSVVVITDGEVLNTNAVLTAVASARSTESRCHVFSLGIGGGCSKPLVDGLSHAGDGVSEYAREGERIEPKVMRLLKAVLHDRILNQSITWSPKLNVYSTFPAEFRVENNCTTTIFGFFSGRLEQQNVTATEDVVSFHGEFRAMACDFHSSLSSSVILPEGDMLHCLGVRERIKELENSCVPGLMHRNPKKQHSEMIVELSTKYGVLSTLTSYVGVQRNISSTDNSMTPTSAAHPTTPRGEGCPAFDTFQKRQHTVPRQVKLLDGTVRTILVDERRPIKEAIETILDSIGITHAADDWFFDSGIDTPLDSKKSLLEQPISPESLLLLKKKLYIADSNLAIEPTQCGIIYKTVKEQIINGTLYTTREEMVQLASLDALVTLGVFDTSQNKKSLKLKLQDLLPPSLQNQKHILKEIETGWARLGKMDPECAKYRYVQHAHSLPTFGMSIFPCKVKSKGALRDILLGVSRSNIFELDPASHTVTKTYPLHFLKRWGPTASSLTIDFGGHSDEYLNLITSDGQAISRLIHGYVDCIVKMRRDCTADDCDSAVCCDSAPAPPEAKIGFAVKALQSGRASCCQSASNSQQNESAEQSAASQKLLSIALLQNADGSWPATEPVAAAIGVTLEKVLSAIPPHEPRQRPEQQQQQQPPSDALSTTPSSVDAHQLWMTFVVLDFLEKNLSALRDEWELLASKSMDWAEAQCALLIDVSPQSWGALASALLASL